MNTPTHMFREIREIPDATQNLIDHGASSFADTATKLRNLDPSVIVTAARGSSDHAAKYFKYVCEMKMGIPVASVGPSVASVYGAALRLKGAACIGVSQSGQSPDIVETVRSARQNGALSVAITNEAHSPLSDASDHTIQIHAGREQSVAATKTFVNSIVAGLSLIARWSRDDDLSTAISNLPKQFEAAIQYDWPELSDALLPASNLFVLGRGLSNSIANEVALKFKETCRVQAESYSSAEVLHGPVSVVEPGFPVLVMAAQDATEASVASVCDTLTGQGARVFATTDLVQKATSLGFVKTGHPLTDALVQVVSFYTFVEGFSRARGFDPDQPRHLNKVTETV